MPETEREDLSAIGSSQSLSLRAAEQEQNRLSNEKSVKPIITIKGLTKVFTLGREKVIALNGIDLQIYPNEIVCLLGTSGSGKSTLLNMLAGLEKPTNGSIVIYGERIDKMSERKLAIFRQKNMGFVFQSYNLLPNLSAIDNVALPLSFAGVKKKVRNKRARKMLKLVGLGKRMRHKPTQMSGGQQQRVGIARAFVGTPKIVFADEPTGNLDTKTTIEIMEMMVRMARENRQTLIIVTHDIEIAAYADTIYHISDGKISSVEDNREKQIVPGKQGHDANESPPVSSDNQPQDLSQASSGIIAAAESEPEIPPIGEIITQDAEKEAEEIEKILEKSDMSEIHTEEK